ncbi:hypothetical protein ACF06P_35550 [Streptomyces sp. NPDC015684]|uniref:hypothetical protein n=1 Tax=Streptomyces sp. NPDC015684 TaxID=3364963 RepID=UPI0036FE4CEA
MRNLSPEQRLIRFQALVDQAGWKMSFVFDGDSARIEAFHPSRAAVMVTARAGRDRVNAYVLPPAVRDLPRWLSVRAASVEFFLTHLTLPPGQRHHPVTWLCKCPKTGRFPTESWAKHFMTDIAIHEGLRRYRGSALRRAYLCPDDNRVWHVTRRKKWYPPTDKDATA